MRLRKLGANEIIAEVDRLEQLVREMPQPLTHRQIIARVLLDFNERGGEFLAEDTVDNAAKALADWDVENGTDWWSIDGPNAEHSRNYYRRGARAILDALAVREGEG